MGKKTFGILSTVLKSSKATGLITLDQATHSTYYLGRYVLYGNAHFGFWISSGIIDLLLTIVLGKNCVLSCVKILYF